MKTLSILLISLVLLSSCANNKTIDGKTYTTYGFLNEEDYKNPKIHYNISVGNVIWSILLCETIVAPFYFIGFDLYEPYCLENGMTENKGVVQ